MYRKLLFLAFTFATAAQAQTPNTLTLGCRGTLRESDSKPELVSMGIIINFTTRTVQGFGGEGISPSQ
jgi:hypothetical protein